MFDVVAWEMGFIKLRRIRVGAVVAVVVDGGLADTRKA